MKKIKLACLALSSAMLLTGCGGGDTVKVDYGTGTEVASSDVESQVQPKLKSAKVATASSKAFGLKSAGSLSLSAIIPSFVLAAGASAGDGEGEPILPADISLPMTLNGDVSSVDIPKELKFNAAISNFHLDAGIRGYGEDAKATDIEAGISAGVSEKIETNIPGVPEEMKGEKTFEGSAYIKENVGYVYLNKEVTNVIVTFVSVIVTSIVTGLSGNTSEELSSIEVQDLKIKKTGVFKEGTTFGVDSIVATEDTITDALLGKGSEYLKWYSYANDVYGARFVLAKDEALALLASQASLGAASSVELFEKYLTWNKCQAEIFFNGETGLLGANADLDIKINVPSKELAMMAFGMSGAATFVNSEALDSIVNAMVEGYPEALKIELLGDFDFKLLYNDEVTINYPDFSDYVEQNTSEDEGEPEPVETVE
ncbi:MAG: hypothetical protein K5694_04390 [Bacilli bacterium]|nr:hypothetical protein [Bacilli bacterium]